MYNNFNKTITTKEKKKEGGLLLQNMFVFNQLVNNLRNKYYIL